ncbi:alpha/beta fold hydrolase [Pseudoduganella aquatica]|uniref:Alpha/beta fold hydrolase n=1 Tax=Pseudoduganella aquatica TaxID=2660641 RepID=A0A7X4KQ64_9BURK|nr:alpha/beta hydrolase [Pseudoduganella aquatica]MYN10600.1 alpha/beta fold hydrolase [Pseudoduganella aquatica]
MFKRLICSILLAGAFSAAAAAPSAFNVKVTGAGAPVILIPGLASPGEVWDGTVQRFCASRQCHVLTLAGFAGAPAIDAPLLPAVEQQLSAYISENKLARPLLIGHSMGGFLALKMAADHPAQVGRVVVVDALPALGATQLPNVTSEQLEAMAAQMRDRLLGTDPASFAAQQRRTAGTLVSGEADAERVAGWSLQSDRKTMATSIYQMLSQDLRQELARIQAPTLVLGSWAAYKSFLPRSAVEAMFKSQYQQLPGVQVELADTARHFIMYDDPDWMYARIDQFLK